MLQGKAIRQVLMQALDTAHCAMFVSSHHFTPAQIQHHLDRLVNGEKGEPLSVAMDTTTAEAGAPTGNQCRSIGAIAARAWSTSARMARARTAAAAASEARAGAAAPEPAAQRELLLELERGRVLVEHVCGSLLIVLIAVPRAGAPPADFGLLRRKAVAARTLLEPPLRAWVAERARLAAIPLEPQQDAVAEAYA